MPNQDDVDDRVVTNIDLCIIRRETLCEYQRQGRDLKTTRESEDSDSSGSHDVNHSHTALPLSNQPDMAGNDA